VADGERFVIILHDDGPPKPGDPPTAIRLRQFLKLALRRFNLRCESIVSQASPPPPEAGGAGR
jgi:hypothetical protein